MNVHNTKMVTAGRESGKDFNTFFDLIGMQKDKQYTMMVIAMVYSLLPLIL